MRCLRQAAAAVSLAAAAMLAAGCGGTAPESATAVPTETPAAQSAGPQPERASTERRDARKLALSKEGNPIVWVRKGERVRIHAEPGGAVVRSVGARTEFGSPTTFAVFERRGGWAAVPTPHTANDELGWVRLDRRRLEGGHTHREIEVDLSEKRAVLSVGDKPKREFAITIGAPGSATPTGRFAVTDTFRGGLHPTYGCCAVALTAEQPNAPSGWVGGNRIAFHGTTGPLGEELSLGCMRAADRDVGALVKEVPPGTPVTVRG